jgi:hypothetical protein
MVQIAFLVSLESPHEGGCMGLVCKILQILTIKEGRYFVMEVRLKGQYLSLNLRMPLGTK